MHTAKPCECVFLQSDFIHYGEQAPRMATYLLRMVRLRKPWELKSLLLRCVSHCRPAVHIVTSHQRAWQQCCLLRSLGEGPLAQSLQQTSQTSYEIFSPIGVHMPSATDTTQ